MTTQQTRPSPSGCISRIARAGSPALAGQNRSTCLRFTHPGKFGKLQAMKQKFGDTAGTVIHTIAYSVVPIIAGIIFIIQGSRGLSLF